MTPKKNKEDIPGTWSAVGAAAVTAIGISLSACSPTRVSPCLPPDAMSLVVPTEPRQKEFSASGPVDVYIDESGSMAGFINGATATDRPLQDLVARMPWLVGSTAGAPMSFTLFGAGLHHLNRSEVDRLATVAPYSCRGGADCDNQQTRLDLVLEAIKALPTDHMAVVVTDLWLSAADLPAAGPAALAAPLSAILQQGRDLGVLGIATAYNGPIFDIPNAPTYHGARSHPLFVLLIGPTDRVESFRDRLVRVGGTSFQSGRFGWSLFSLEPRAGDVSDPRPLHVTQGPEIAERPTLPVMAGAPI